MHPSQFSSIAPFFIVSSVPQTLAFYVERLGFQVMYRQPPGAPFFAIVRRDSVMIFLKHGENVPPVPNCLRHPSMKWDAYISVLDPDSLAIDFARRGLSFHTPLAQTSEGLRGFEVRDPDGYVLFFGRPHEGS